MVGKTAPRDDTHDDRKENMLPVNVKVSWIVNKLCERGEERAAVRSEVTSGRLLVIVCFAVYGRSVEIARSEAMS